MRQLSLGCAMTLAAIAVSLSACAPAPPPAPPIASATPSPTVGPLEAYQQYWQVTEASARNPASRDWAADITQVTVDPLRTSDIADWRKFRDLGVIQGGELRFAPRLISNSGGVAQIADCVDDSAVSSTQAGRALTKPAGYPPRHSVDATAQLIDGAWRMSAVVQHWTDSC